MLSVRIGLAVTCYRSAFGWQSHVTCPHRGCGQTAGVTRLCGNAGGNGDAEDRRAGRESDDGGRTAAPEQRIAVAARQRAVSEASRRARGPRSPRSGRRREGCPPEGLRPRSGLGRAARSRSDTPKSKNGTGDSSVIVGSITGTCGRWSSGRSKKISPADRGSRRAAAQPPLFWRGVLRRRGRTRRPGTRYVPQVHGGSKAFANANGGSEGEARRARQSSGWVSYRH